MPRTFPAFFLLGGALLTMGGASVVGCAGSEDRGDLVGDRRPTGATPDEDGSDDGGVVGPDAKDSGDPGLDPDAGPGGPTADADAGKPAKDYARGSSVGCGNASAGKGLQDRKMTVAGKSRAYLRFIPQGYDANKAYPLVFALHGSGGTKEKARAMVDLEEKANGKALFIYPEGLPDPAFGGDNRWDPSASGDDLKFIDALVAEIEKSHCVDRDRIFMTGFSNGARMTSMVGCYRGDAFRAIAPVAPGGNATTLPLGDGRTCVGEVAIWEGLGTMDADHKAGAELVRDYYRTANGCSASRTPVAPSGCEAFVGCRAEVPSVWCTYPLGHQWPSFGAAAVWSFFDARR